MFPLDQRPPPGLLYLSLSTVTLLLILLLLLLCSRESPLRYPAKPTKVRIVATGVKFIPYVESIPSLRNMIASLALLITLGSSKLFESGTALLWNFSVSNDDMRTLIVQSLRC